MKNLKRLTAAVALTLVLGVCIFAGDISTPPCAPPAPGDIQTPPCSGGQVASDASDTPGIISTPPASDAGTEYLVADAAISLFESLLPIF